MLYIYIYIYIYICTIDAYIFKRLNQSFMRLVTENKDSH